MQHHRSFEQERVGLWYFFDELDGGVQKPFDHKCILLDAPICARKSFLRGSVSNLQHFLVFGFWRTRIHSSDFVY